MSFRDIHSKEELLQAVTKNTNLSVLLLHASWNNHDKITKAQPQIVNSLRATIREHEGLSIHGFAMKVDINDDSMDFFIGDTTMDDDVVMDDANTTQINIKCIDELPALYVLNYSNEGMIQISNVPINARQILSWSESEDAVTEAMEKAISSLAIIPSSIQQNTRNFEESKRMHPQQQIRLFIAGDRSQVGKSSVCLGILGTLLQMNYPPSALAYIKPATQCEKTQLVTEYCKKHGIQVCPEPGPVVYYRGFTRAFLNGETESSDVLLKKITEEVDKIARDKTVVVIDGVGYPAVGSITHTDNACVAQASGYPNNNDDKVRIPPGVLIVGKRGVGDAVDSYNLNSTYFRSRNIPVLGAIFNRLPHEGYYSLENCKQAVTSYFVQNKDTSGGEKVFGFIPEVEGIASSRTEKNDGDANISSLELAMEDAEMFIVAFGKFVDVGSILQRATHLRDIARRNDEGPVGHQYKRARITKHKDALKLNGTMSRSQLTRDQIEQSAKASGAAGG
mmetsp:Transcript_14618/g.21946  ORF Transcript_14618/g.21946 Transcript_14618/m.21946 type:complete len:507 (+) Transcript_14618:61-1581(+)